MVHPIDNGFIHERTSLGDLRFLFVLSKYASALPIGSDLKINNAWLLYSLIVLIIITGVNVIPAMLYFKRLAEYDATSWTKTVLYLSQMILQNLCAITHYISLIYNKQEFNKLITYCTTNKFATSHYAKFYLIPGCIIIGGYYISFLIFRTTFKLAVAVLFCRITNYLILLQVCAFLEDIEDQIKLLILLIRRNRQIFPIIDRHNELLNLARVTNHVYTWQILIACILTFINCISWMFYQLDEVLNEDLKIVEGISRVVYSMWNLVTIYMVTDSCEKINKQAEEFINELFNHMRESKFLYNNERLSLYVTMKHTVQFTAGGFFNLGYPVITNIIAAATTYLVILVQFSLPTNNY